MKRKLLVTTLVVALAKITFAQFTAENLVVLRVGDGTTYNTGITRPVSLVEFAKTGGAPIGSVNLNATTAGSRLTIIDNAATEGLLKLSTDKNYLSLAGYDLASNVVATTAIAATTTKVIVRSDINKVTDYTTKILAGDFASNFRSAYTQNGSSFYFTSASGGVRSVPFGNPSSTTSTVICQLAGAANYTNAYSIGISNGQLYAGFFNTTNYGLSAIGTGIPTTSVTPTSLQGLPKAAKIQDFVFFDLDATIPGDDVLYVTEAAELKKYSLVAGTWTLNSTVALTNVSFGLTGSLTALNKVQLFFTVGTATPASGVAENNDLQTVTDANGYNTALNGTVATIASAGVGYAFRGVSFTPGSGVLTVLPVSLTSFNGKNTTQGVSLSWETASELSNQRFDVLRSSDKDNFQLITSVSGKGTSSLVNKYSYLDNQPAGGTNYYQLNQVDFDGNTTPSKVIAVKTGLEENEFSINVLENNLNLTITAVGSVDAKLQIFDTNGRRVIIKDLRLETGLNTAKIMINDLSTGVYVTQLTIGTEVITKKFIK